MDLGPCHLQAPSVRRRPCNLAPAYYHNTVPNQLTTFRFQASEQNKIPYRQPQMLQRLYQLLFSCCFSSNTHWKTSNTNMDQVNTASKPIARQISSCCSYQTTNVPSVLRFPISPPLPPSTGRWVYCFAVITATKPTHSMSKQLKSIQNHTSGSLLMTTVTFCILSYLMSTSPFSYLFYSYL